MNQENNQIVHVRMVAREEDSGFWPNLEFAMPKFFPQNYSVFETELKMNFNDFEMFCNESQLESMAVRTPSQQSFDIGFRNGRHRRRCYALLGICCH
jgi:hypothetical protein